MDIRERILVRVLTWWARHGGVAQFHRPTGAIGHVAGWIMGRRSSNVARSRWAVRLLDVRPTDRVIELGCGPGVAIAALAAAASRGVVVGVDHSAVMISQARRRNRAAIRAGRVRLINAPVQDLSVSSVSSVSDGPFDAALAVNTVGMWPDPAARLGDIARLMRPGGCIALVSQPRCIGATAATSATAAGELASILTAAGLDNLRTETLELDPPVACVIGHVAATRPAGQRLASGPTGEHPRSSTLHNAHYRRSRKAGDPQHVGPGPTPRHAGSQCRSWTACSSIARS